MSVSALAVANYFIKKSLNEKREFQKLTPMKLLKMIYLAHGLYLAEFNKPLIKENVIAWRYGPVIRNVYDSFKKYGNTIITETANTIDDEDSIKPQTKDYDKITELLNGVWNSCLDIGGIQLSNWSHEPDSPWDRVYNHSPFGTSGRKKITNELIRQYFAKVA